ncbi:hypothetical protein WJX73_005784 [Symbiochloris irregularis]|uniref:N-acetyltransferase 10 n=1 Tax=Symbiochloris irregularis TaxID=706552 RepID=A0AAW1NLM1_9CHLO
MVRAMLGPYLVFLCSTVNGYEGTGRSLSLKLLQQLRSEGAKTGMANGASAASEGAGVSGRTFKEVQLQEPIRYAAGDRVEAWLHELLCLDAADRIPSVPARLPHPNECELYMVDRDTLFSYHKASEALLQRMMALYVASHYRNTPNDLMLASDAPAHVLFVLLGPVDETQNVMPDILAVVQVALEGAISRKVAQNSLAHGNLPQGDLIPWTVGQQVQDPDFPSLSGVRIVRIATHPDLPRAGYGSRAVELLARFYRGELRDPAAAGGHNGTDEAAGGAAAEAQAVPQEEQAGGDLLTEKVGLRKGLPPLLVHLSERTPEAVQWLGVAFGLTDGLLSFWNRSGFQPVYLRQTPSDVTGEHSLIMLQALESAEVLEPASAWLASFVSDFRSRFMSLLPGPFRDFAPALAMALLQPQLTFAEGAAANGHTPVRGDGSPLSPYDLKRLQAYANSLVDYHLIMDLTPPLTRSFFAGKLPVTLSAGQAAILLCLGLQQNAVDVVARALGLPGQQVLALFNKAMRKIHDHLRASKVAAIERTMPQASAAPSLLPHAVGVDEDLDEAAQEVQRVMQEALKPEQLGHYAVTGDLEAAAGGKVPASGLVSLPRTAAAEGQGQQPPAPLYKKDRKNKHKSGGAGRGKPGKKQRR